MTTPEEYKRSLAGLDADIAAQATTIPPPSVQDDDDADEGKRSQADQLVAFAKGRFTLLHDEAGDTYARDRQTGELVRLGRQFKDRIVSEFYKATEFAVRDNAWREALGTLQAIARFEGEPVQVHLRAAGSEGLYYLDLCQPGNSRAVEITATGYRVVDAPPVLFVRGEAMQKLPDPRAGGGFAPLWQIANIPPAQRLLILAWLVDCLRPDSPFPVLELYGEQGSAKSTTAEALRKLIDPNASNLRSAPKSCEDIFVGAVHSHCISFENISHLPGSMQDALCVLATGGGFAKRTLYSDSDETILNVRRPVILNGISTSVTQQDLADRSVSIECPVIEDRQSATQLWRNFDEALPSVLGALLSLAARAMALLPYKRLPADQRPRMLDYALLGMAVAEAQGETAEAFLEQYKAARAETVSRALDSSPVATALIELVDDDPAGIEAPVKDILRRLESYKPAGAEAWPRTPKGLGDALRRAAPALRQTGISCRCLGKIGGSVKWSIKRKLPSPSPACPASPDDSEFKQDMQDMQDFETATILGAEL